jgi:hypothetical protein
MALTLFCFYFVAMPIFVYDDIIYLIEMYTPGEEIVFEAYSTLTPLQEIISLWLFLIAAIGLMGFSGVLLSREKYKSAVASGTVLLLLFVFQFWFWTMTTLQGS